MARTKTKPELVGSDAVEPLTRRNRHNLFELAYEQLEARLVTCELKPGSHMTMQQLQDMTGFGRTPIHHAVTRLAADTLIVIRPRHGLQIAPIDLARERVLLMLRRDLERFVVKLAAENANMTHRNQILYIERALRAKQAEITLAEFNVLDLRIDRLIMEAAGEPFLQHTLRPLHTIFRRIGFIYHTYLPGRSDLRGTIERHLAVLDAVANRHVARAVTASDTLMTFMETMFEEMETGIDPRLLDCSVEPLIHL